MSSSYSSPESTPYMKFLGESICNEIIYEALRKDDPAEAVVITMEIIRTTVHLDFKTEFKSEHASNMHRNEGNRFYTAKRLRPALECYNKALKYAPENTQAMKLAFSNRSALLFTVKAYTACVNDIETVFSMGCIDYKLSERLKRRRSECLQYTWLENKQWLGNFGNNFFKFDGKRHSQIPCASTDIDVVSEQGLPKVVAARDVPIGKLIAVESPFVSEHDFDDYNVSCHYCHRFSLNLIPCDGCCIALFCDEQCKSKCKKEYHNIECKIVSYNRQHDNGTANTLRLRAALKIRQMCNSWKEVIAASCNIGEDRMRTSSVSDVFDVKSKFSLLSHNNPKHFVFGERYNQSIMCGLDLIALENLPSFFPTETREKSAAIRALARIMMHLYSSYRKIEVLNCGRTPLNGNQIRPNSVHNIGWFSFTGKLRHNCNANLLILGINNKVALVTIKPLKKGDELTISFLGHYGENTHPVRALRLFQFTEQVCSCKVCVENWNPNNLKKQKLTSGQKKAYKDWGSAIQGRIFEDRDEKVFKATCEGLTALKGAECTSEHHDMFKQFRTLTCMAQLVEANNQFIE